MGSPGSSALQRLQSKLLSAFNEGDYEDALETIRECLRATRTVRAGRDGGGHIIYEEVPDYPIRLMAGLKIVEYTIGKPVSRAIVANVSEPKQVNSVTSGDDLLKLLLADPASAATILQKLQEAALKVSKGAVVELAPPSEGKKPGS